MIPINHIKSKFVVKNLSKRAIKLLNRATLPPSSDSFDLFEIIPNLSEILIIDALRQPDGELYLRVRDGQINIIECDLVVFNNSSIVTTLPSSTTISDPKINIAAEFPLTLDNGNLRLPKASEYSDGFISKDDFNFFKNQAYKINVWQYQDFDKVTSNTLMLSKFNDFKFTTQSIVNGSAFIVNAANQESVIYKDGFLKRLLGNTTTLEVANHIKEKIIINYVPPETAILRVYFLVSAMPNQITNLSKMPIAPDIVRHSRIELVDSSILENNKKDIILGEKKFVAPTTFSKVGIGTSIGPNELSVEGTIKAKKIIISDNANRYHVLSSNMLGEADWQATPIVLEKPPLNPYDGQLWMKAPEFKLFYWDPNNNCWLSVNSNMIYMRGDKDTLTNSFLNIVNNGYGPNDCHSQLTTFNICNVIMECESAEPWALQIINQNGMRLERSLDSSGRNSIVHKIKNLKLNPLDKIKFYVNGENIIKPLVTIEIKESI